MKNCCHIGCKVKQATYGLMTDKTKKYCSEHKTPLMINLTRKLCDTPGCTIPASYGYLSDGIVLKCYTDKTDTMVKLRNKRKRLCGYKGCPLQPVFANVNDSIPLFCDTHKITGMINIKSKKCAFKGCSVNPSFGCYAIATHCVEHKDKNMVNVKNNKCKYVGCQKQCLFGNIGDKKPSYCAGHKSKEMKNIKNKHCQFDGCEKIPYFGFKTDKKPTYCKEHILKGMINIIDKNCLNPDCTKQATYGFKKDNKKLYCAEHKIADMVDLKNKPCNYEKCTVHSSYGKPGFKPTFCSRHREKGMIKRPAAKCKQCNEPAVYGKKFTNLHCEPHKKDDEINLVERECKSCHLISVLDKDNYCEYCNPTTIKTARFSKQNDLMNYLDSSGLKGNSTDKIVNPGCGLERPDRVFETDEYILILECDENQHRDRACSCEQTRMVNIGQAYGGIPVYFIRWNPDDYSPLNPRKVCEDIKKRYKLVGDYIKSILEKRIKLPVALVSAIYLYFDDWDGIDMQNWELITKYE